MVHGQISVRRDPWSQARGTIKISLLAADVEVVGLVPEGNQCMTPGLSTEVDSCLPHLYTMDLGETPPGI